MRMSLSRYFWLLLLAWAACVCAKASPTSLLQLPALDGDFSGDFLLPQTGPATGLAFHWHIIAESPAGAPGTRRARLDITGHGARVVALAELDHAGIGRDVVHE